jgi:hypothetical protein
MAWPEARSSPILVIRDHHSLGASVQLQEAATASLDFLKDGAGFQGVQMPDGIAEKCAG